MRHRFADFVTGIAAGSAFVFAISAEASPIKLQPIAGGVTASSSYPGRPPTLATDGNSDTSWTSNYPTQWIQLDFGRPVSVSRIRLQVDQVPKGATTHTIAVGDIPGALHDVYVIGPSVTSNRQWLEVSGDGLG